MVDIGLSSAEFWALHPVEFVTLMAQWRAKEQRREFGWALLASLYVNAHTDKGPMKTPADFMSFPPVQIESVVRKKFDEHILARKIDMQRRGLRVK